MGIARACEQPASVCATDRGKSFALIRNGQPASIYIDAQADSAVRHVASSFAADLTRVGGKESAALADIAQATETVVLIGVLGQSPVIDQLVAAGKLDARDIAGQWEAFRQIVVDRPFPKVARALVIVGSDRRGAVYGAYDLSEKIGVSPWYWFADVPVRHQANVFVTAGSRRDQPRVRYRGFFINDEDPSFNTWARRKFGGINSKMYTHVFELNLRMKGNYLWPAMWAPKAFNDDDPRNTILADEMGVVMGSSHHEPMTRAQDEWHRHTDQGITGGKWDYTTNAANLRAFWRGGIERMMSKGNGQAYESLVTLGMRGDGDEPMSEGTATQLLQTIVADQRKIIADVTGKPANQTPQVWALYKEVQDYYDHGMQVPDDVTLLFSDDNWGQIRRLPPPDSHRAGGYGVYYHFDYVGGPRNYKWLNTNQIEKTWQQMDLAYASGARALWVVNVGDIKPMEFPLGFFMEMAWNPEAMTPDALQAYSGKWAKATFGPSQAGAIARIVSTYSRLAARRKPELIDPETFRLGASTEAELDGGEFGAIVAEWRELERSTLALKPKIPKEYEDAWFQLVEHPVIALSNLHQLYYAVAWNRRLAAAQDPRANIFADRAEAAYRRDQQITDAYHAMGHGKWDGMMSQIHMGYTSWNDPREQVMPAVTRVSAQSPTSVVFRSTAHATETSQAISIEAPRFSRAVGGKGLQWKVIPNLGRTEGAVIAFPQGQPSTSAEDGVRLEYDVTLEGTGDAEVLLYLAPTLDTRGSDGIRIGVSIDDAPVRQLVSKLVPTTGGASSQAQLDWISAVRNNVHILRTTLPGLRTGKHTLKIWRMDDNAVLQKIVVSTEAIPETYLGPPPSSH
jgi:hypothetical protein